MRALGSEYLRSCFLIKSSEIVFIFLFAFYLIIWLITSSKMTAGFLLKCQNTLRWEISKNCLLCRLWSQKWSKYPLRCGLNQAKIGHHFGNKLISKLTLWRNVKKKKVLPNCYPSMKKQLRKIQIIFEIPNWLWKSNFGTFWHFP